MVTTDASAHHQTHQAYQILRIGFTIAPIIAGLDKFFHLLTDWNQYLAPFIPRMLDLSANTFMMIVGVIEIVAGLLVWVQAHLRRLLLLGGRSGNHHQPP